MLLLALFFLASALPVQALTWTTSRIDGDATHDPNNRTSITIDQDGNYLVAYTNSTDNQIRFAKSTNRGTTWTTSTVATLSTASNTILKVDSNNNYYLIYMGNSGYELAKSTNGGSSWTTSVPSEFGCGPSVIFSFTLDPNNNLLFSCYNRILFSGSKRLKLYKSTDGGSNWTNPLLEILSNAVTDEGISIAAVSTSQYFIAYTLDNNQLLYHQTTNNGTDWTSGTIDADGDNANQLPSATVNSSGHYLVTYREDNNQILKFAKSTNSGATWTTETVDSSLGWSGTTDIINSLYSVSTTELIASYYHITDTNLKFAKSTNSGATWTTETVDSTGDVGKLNSITFDSTNNNYLISYRDTTNSYLKFAKAAGDSSAPSISLDSYSSPTRLTSLTFSGAASDASNITTIRYRIGSGSWTTATATDGTFNSASESFQLDLLSLTDGNYTVYLETQDTLGNTTPPADYSTITFTVDTLAPQINSISTSPISTGTTITWSTNESASTQINYDLNSNLNHSTTETDTSPRTTSHTGTISNLVPCVTYNYRPASQDAATNQGLGSTSTFTTTGCAGSAAVLSQNITDITTNGGTLDLITNNTGISLTAPANFADSTLNLQIKKVDSSTALQTTSTPNSLSLISDHLYDLKALLDVSTTAPTFNQPVTITINYSDNQINHLQLNESQLSIYRWDGSTWHQLTNCNANSNTNTVTCTTQSFSVFGLFGNTNSSSTSSPTHNASVCTDLTPKSAPYLFEIRRTTDKAKIYFSPAGDPLTYYYIAYGTKANPIRHGVSFAQGHSSGILSFTINKLKPNLIYYFQIRAGNGCMPGSWSNRMPAKPHQTSYYQPSRP